MEYPGGLLCFLEALAFGPVVSEFQASLWHFQNGSELSRLRSILLTAISVETVGGLPGLLLTLNGIGVQKLRIVGPEPLTQFLLMFGYAIRSRLKGENSMTTLLSVNSRDFLDSLEAAKSDLEIEVIEIFPNSLPNSSKPLKLELDHEVLLECYLDQVGAEKGPEHEYSGCSSAKRRCTKVTYSSNPSILYKFKFPEKKGKFNLEKAKALKIPPGPLYSKLKNGEPVELSDSRVILPEDVCSPPIKLPWAIVLSSQGQDQDKILCARIAQILKSNGFDFLEHESPEVPSHEFLLFQFCSGSSSSPKLAELDNQAVSNRNYLSQGVIKLVQLDEDLLRLEKGELNPFITSTLLQEFLNSISPFTFPSSSSMIDELAWNRQFFIPACQRDRKNFNSLVNIDKKKSKFTLSTPESEAQIRLLRDGFLDSSTNSDAQLPEFPLLYVLGTGSAIPSPYRNVSGNLLRLDENTSILLDCGEGSVFQIFRLSNLDFGLFSKIIASIKIVFISHPHEDHFLGLFKLIQLKTSPDFSKTHQCFLPEQEKGYYLKDGAFFFGDALTKEDFSGLVVIGPKSIQGLYKLFQEKIMVSEDHHSNYCQVSFIAIDKGGYDEIQKRNSCPGESGQDCFLKLEPFAVRHIRSSFGLKITLKLVRSELGRKSLTIVFSGDTVPCTSVEEASKNCDVLIHEATFEDALQEDAWRKNHSTISGAVQTAYRASAGILLLTHFSQRYFSTPKSKCNDLPVSQFE
ncbi:zinc phosphodiesterase ELAC protein 2-like isoform X2 [Cryptosporidium felis]|nr:zinc phosphodiesterase ELAC protein 2-like isoform X2 [Cryptosporidium felis]